MEATDVRGQRSRKKLATQALHTDNPEYLDAKTSLKQIENGLNEAFLKTETTVVVDWPYSEEDFEPMPELKNKEANPEFNEFDLLSDDLLLRFCKAIVDDMASPELAAMSVGIPPATMKEYLDTGNADLAAGLPTRKALLARLALKGAYAVISASMRQIRRLPVGWQNHSVLLISLFPEFFSEKRTTKKEALVASRQEALQRQLGAAYGASGASLPPLPQNVQNGSSSPF